MKEATSELGTGVIVVISVGVFVTFFYFVVWPIIENNFAQQTSCEKAVCEVEPDKDGYVNCKYKSHVIRCKYKG